MKKLGLLIMPLMAISFLASCNNGGGGSVPEPSGESLPLCFVCNSESGTLNYGRYEKFSNLPNDVVAFPNLEYSTDLVKWVEVPKLSIGNLIQKVYDFKKGEKIYLRGDNPEGWYSPDAIPTSFQAPSSTDFSVRGNIMSLISKDNFDSLKKIPCKRCFSYIFADSTITNASELLLPATELTDNCYQSMFEECSNLVKAPATLPSMTLADSCYEQMFRQCAKLIEAPYLPATELDSEYSYSFMFRQCSSLKYLKVGFGTPSKQDWPDIIDQNSNWLDEVSPNGTFVWRGSEEGPATRSINTVPEGWAIETY